MIGIVTKDLDKSIQRSTENPDESPSLKTGDEVEIVEILNGDKVDGNAIWYKLESGTYVWSGGIKGLKNMPPPIEEEQLVEQKPTTVSDSEFTYNSAALQWWHKDFGITDIWDQGHTGQGVKVAVLDSGFSSKSSFLQKPLEGWDFTNDGSDFDDIDGHGTATAGILGAYADDYIGIAPMSELYIAKFFSSQLSDDRNIKNLELAIDQILKMDIDVVSMSYGYVVNASSSLKDKFQKLSQKSIIVCSIGNDYQYEEINRFPASFKSTLGVGACDEKNIVLNSSNLTSNVDLLAPGSKIITIGLSNNINETPVTGTSYSTPFIAGLLALAISALKASKKEYNLEELVKTLLATTDNDSENEKLYGEGVVNPLKFVQNLK